MSNSILPQSSRIPLKERAHLSIYWDNHLRDAFEEAVVFLYPAMVEASLAHVHMLKVQGIVPAERADALLAGLRRLFDRAEAGEQDYPFDGSVEDPYYFLEQRLAAQCGISTSELDVQLGRSRNDLDAGVFRMVLRRQLIDQAELVLQAAADAAAQASANADSLIIGFTHRRPAQPTTIGHVLVGLSEALISQAADMLDLYDEINVSPLGAAAFAGTDLPIDPALLSELLGFDRPFTSSYEAVAGAEHFMRLAAVHGRITATGARWSRVLLEWMTFRWVKTPDAFTQGSSIMPQKKNPVVLEHMVSMAGATAADMAATYANVGAAWYEDSNNATTDIQKHLWRSGERLIRFLRMMDGLLVELEPQALPSREEIVASGATTTAVAEALAVAGVPWRRAHDVVGKLVRAKGPESWTAEDVVGALGEGGGEASDRLADLMLAAAQQPERILDRAQAGSPGRAAVRIAADSAAARAAELACAFAKRRGQLDGARARLLETTAGKVQG